MKNWPHFSRYPIVDLVSLIMPDLLLLQTNDPHTDIIYQPMIYHCAMDNPFVWLLLVYGFKGILLIFGLFLAWETRKVKIAALNDSHHIGKCGYPSNLLTTVKSGNSSSSSGSLATSVLSRLSTI